MGWLSALTGWLPGSRVVSAISGAVSSWQDRRAQASAAKARANEQRLRLRGEWELLQAKRSTAVLRWTTFTILWGPILYAFYVALQALPVEATPEDVGAAVKAATEAFPGWWTGAAVSVLLAVWGMREMQHGSITQAAMRVKEQQHAETGATGEPNASTERDKLATGAPRGLR